MAHNMQAKRGVYLVYKGYTRNRWAAMALNETSQKGLKDGWTRATFILRKDYLEKLKSLSYWQRRKLKEVVNEALGSYLEGQRIRRKTSR
jgi:hypothetical protein